MKNANNGFKSWLFATFLTLTLLASVSLAITAKTAEALSFQDTLNITPHIRTLAASCAACHGSNGNSVSTTPSLAGLDGTYFTTQMLAFKDGSRPATVMHHHAKGLNIEEINLLANYFLQQKRVISIAPKPQTLSTRHEN